MIEPIRNQWAAVEPILNMGGRVETSPSKIPNWMKRLLPEGQTENIDAVFFNYRRATDEAIEALEKLPYLRRLYVEQASLNSKHLETISRLKKLERLSIWGNEKLTNDDLTPLANLGNLEVLDIHRCTSADWKSLLPFSENQNIKIVQSFPVSDFEPAELDDLKSVERFCGPYRRPNLISSRAADLKKLLENFPEVSYVWVSFEDEIDSTYFTQLLEISREQPFEIVLYAPQPKNLPPTSPQLRVRHAIRSAWEQLGPQCDSLGIETCSTYPDANSLIFRYTKDAIPVKVSIYIQSEIGIPESFFKQLPVLPGVETFTMKSDGDNLITGIEYVLEKIPNVTEVNCLRAEKWHREFWDQLTKLEKVEKLTISNSMNVFFVPTDFPDKFLSRKTLTELNVKVSRYDHDPDLKGRFQNACPNLKSFMVNERQLIKAK